MNIYLKKFIEKKIKKTGSALDLGAGDFIDVVYLKKTGWKCDGVDIKTGVNLEKPYKSENRPYDLVYSNYVLHKLKNRQQIIKTIFDNLKDAGWFFIHTFDKGDPNSTSDLTDESLKQLLVNQGFTNIEIKLFDYFDNDKGHKHWHKILEATGQKPPLHSATKPNCQCRQKCCRCMAS